MKTYHVLNGDCLVEKLKLTNINQNFIVCRECLIDGDLCEIKNADDPENFFKIRSKFISETYNIPVDEYYLKTVNEFEKLINIPDGSEVCLWFENDLFCQTNIWFILFLIGSKPTLKFFRVFPVIENGEDTWKGFGLSSTEKLEEAFRSKVRLSSDDIELGINLWTAYQKKDFKKLKELSLSNGESESFKYLEEVCQAHIDRFPTCNSLGRPEKIVKEIIIDGFKEFKEVFVEFSKREGIYGFGDLQIKKIYNRQMLNK